MLEKVRLELENQDMEEKKNCKTANQQGAKKKKKNCHMDITRNLEKFVNWEINYV